MKNQKYKDNNKILDEETHKILYGDNPTNQQYITRLFLDTSFFKIKKERLNNDKQISK